MWYRDVAGKLVTNTSRVRHQHRFSIHQFESLGRFEPVYLRQIQKPKIPISRNVIKRRKCPESKSKILVFLFSNLFAWKLFAWWFDVPVTGVLRWILSYLAPSTLSPLTHYKEGATYGNVHLRTCIILPAVHILKK